MNKGQRLWTLGVLVACVVGLLFAYKSLPAAKDKCGFIAEKGLVRYYDSETHEYLTGQQKVNGYWYMFAMEGGAMVTGFYDHTEETNPNGGEKTCYYDEAGHMCYGQKYIDGYWYNFGTGSGAMLTGFVEIPSQDKICYYDEQGHMLYGTQVIKGKTYVFEEGTGALLDQSENAE